MDTKYTCAHYPKKSESPKSQAFKEFNSNHADFFIYGPSQSSYLMLEKIINSNSVEFCWVVTVTATVTKNTRGMFHRLLKMFSTIPWRV